MDTNQNPIIFEWDKWNTDKNWQKHGVSTEEAEQAFFDKKKITTDDVLHSQIEKRYILIGKTKKERLLYIVYTIRNDAVRVISARDTNRRENKLYEEAA